jgi:hypothetical protein
MVGGTAKHAQARCIQWIIRQPSAFTGVERLSGVIGLHAAAFEHNNLEWLAAELARQGNACCATPDYANIGLDDFTVGDGAGIDKHTSFLSAMRRLDESCRLRRKN